MIEIEWRNLFDIDWKTIHAITIAVEFLFEWVIVPIAASILVYFRLSIWYKIRNITGYYSDYDIDSQQIGNAIIRVSYHFHNRIEIFGIEANNVAWVGKYYKYSDGDISGRFDWNVYGEQARQFIPDYGDHEIHTIPNSNPTRMHVVSKKRTGSYYEFQSNWQRINSRKLNKGAKRRFKNFKKQNKPDSSIYKVYMKMNTFRKQIQLNKTLRLLSNVFILIVIFFFAAFIVSAISKVTFISVIISWLSLSFHLWQYLLLTFCLVILLYILKSFRLNSQHEKSQGISNLTTTPEIPLPAVIDTRVYENLIFDSSFITSEDEWNHYGQKIWDNNLNKLVGETGLGKIDIKDNILTINRDNTSGRYIIFPKKYFYHKKPTLFIPANIYGKGTRDFRVTFSSRIFSDSA